MCVFDECDTPLEIFSSSRDWLAHMRSQHCMRWHCFATSHEPSFFGSPGALEDHLTQTHAGHFTTEEISFLVENSRHPSLSVIEHCPFCQQRVENTEEHVAQHLIQFALRSMPWPDDCYSSHHFSQPSRSAHSEGIRSSQGGEAERDGTLDVRKTDWDAWEKNFQAEGNNSESFKSQYHDEPIPPDEGSFFIGLDDLALPNYDAAEDELLEPFRQRTNLEAAKDLTLQTKLSERQISVRNFIKSEAMFVWNLGVLTDVYKAIAEDVLDQKTADCLFRNLDQLVAMRKRFLNDLEEAVQFDWNSTRFPISSDNTVSSTAPDFIGSIVLEHFRSMWPAHEAYFKSHEGAVSLWESIRDESVQPSPREFLQRLQESHLPILSVDSDAPAYG